MPRELPVTIATEPRSAPLPTGATLSPPSGAVQNLARGERRYAEIELFGEQPSRHASHEQQTVNRALIAREHRVTGTWRDGAPFVSVALAMRSERMQECEGFVSCSVPGDSSCHGRWPGSIDR
jgi:hypothetical protein